VTCAKNPDKSMTYSNKVKTLSGAEKVIEKESLAMRNESNL
jgi:hypothetical protein